MDRLYYAKCRHLLDSDSSSASSSTPVSEESLAELVSCLDKLAFSTDVEYLLLLSSCLKAACNGSSPGLLEQLLTTVSNQLCRYFYDPSVAVGTEAADQSILARWCETSDLAAATLQRLRVCLQLIEPEQFSLEMWQWFQTVNICSYFCDSVLRNNQEESAVLFANYKQTICRQLADSGEYLQLVLDNLRCCQPDGLLSQPWCVWLAEEFLPAMAASPESARFAPIIADWLEDCIDGLIRLDDSAATKADACRQFLANLLRCVGQPTEEAGDSFSRPLSQLARALDELVCLCSRYKLRLSVRLYRRMDKGDLAKHILDYILLSQDAGLFGLFGAYLQECGLNSDQFYCDYCSARLQAASAATDAAMHMIGSNNDAANHLHGSDSHGSGVSPQDAERTAVTVLGRIVNEDARMRCTIMLAEQATVPWSEEVQAVVEQHLALRHRPDRVVLQRAVTAAKTQALFKRYNIRQHDASQQDAQARAALKGLFSQLASGRVTPATVRADLLLLTDTFGFTVSDLMTVAVDCALKEGSSVKCRDLLACPLRDLGITVSLQDRLQAALRCVQRAHIGLQLYNPAYVSANEADFLLDLGCLATDAYFSQLAEAGSDPGPAGLESAVVARIGRTIRLMRFTWRAARLLGNTVPDYERLIDNGDAAAVAYLAKLHGLPSSDWLRQLASLLLLVDNKNLGISGSTDTPKLLPLLVPALLTVDGLSVWRVAQLLLDAGLSELAARQNLDALLKAARVSLLELDDDSDIDSISDSNSDISSGLSALGELLTIACRLGGFGSALSLHRLHTCLRIIQSCRCCCCLAESGAVNSSDSAAQLGMALEVRYEDSAIMSLPSTQRLMFLKLTGQMMRLTERASDAAPAVAIDQTPSNATLINLASQAIDTLRLAGRPLAALTLATLLSELQDNTDSLGAADSLPSICQDRCHALLTGLLSQRLEAKLIDKQLCQSAAWSLPESVGQSVLRRVAQKSRHSYNRLEFIARLAYHYGAQRGNPEHAKRALALAKGAYWSRTLSALGIKIGDLTAPGKAAECAETLCSLPVSKSLQPDLLLYYCQQYQQPAAAHLLRYLENLLFPQSGSQVEVSQGAVNLAGATLAVLKRVSHPDELLNRLLGYYAQLDPYEYESIELICCSLLAMPQCPEAQAAHCSRALQLLASLKRYRRVSQISSYERNWYQKRMQRPDLAEWYFTSASAINSKSSRRLNLFALLEPKLYKIVNPELRFDTLDYWLGVSDLIGISETELKLSAADKIFEEAFGHSHLQHQQQQQHEAKVNNWAAQPDLASQMAVARMEKVLTSVYDSERALHVAFAMLKRTSLGWLKLRITRICLAVCQAWSETETTAAPPQPPATLQQQKLTGGAAQQSIHRAEASLKRYRDILEALECEQALHANGLSDCSDLAKLCSSPSELLNRLVSAGEAEAASQVAEILGADLSAVVAKRVQDWLGIKPAGSGADGSPGSDSQQSQSMLDLSADALLSVNVCDMMSQMQQQQRDELDQLLDDEQRLADTADLIVRLVQRSDDRARSACLATVRDAWDSEDWRPSGVFLACARVLHRLEADSRLADAWHMRICELQVRAHFGIGMGSRPLPAWPVGLGHRHRHAGPFRSWRRRARPGAALRACCWLAWP
ncbi:hypothetical protein BOX15_Mlig000904g17 [Macrostomum lignano]|uniref:Uncharacterized protein n=1 Tax=Macrostomum lignano TaxID=282301 RepID=A0A267E1F0_9PLAT|nr:hypothetical protein BOX15_Mlig000904g17 [Macrostomum lignano]